MNIFKETKTTPTIKVLERAVPVIKINPDALTKMKLFIDNCIDEIGWLGTACKNKNTIYIEDVILFQQEVHSATTEITPEGLAEFAEEIMKQPNGMDVWNNIKVWGHSHVYMTTSPSGQDDKQMETFIEGGHDWFIRIIANKKSELRIDLYDYSIGVIYNDLPWQEYYTNEELILHERINKLYEALGEIQTTRTTKFTDEIKREIAIKVKKKYTTIWQGQTPTSKTDLWTNTTNTGNKKKEKEKNKENIGNYKFKDDRFSMFDTVEEVYSFFGNEIGLLMNAGECISTNEVMSVLADEGYERYFSQQDVHQIWLAGKAISYFSLRVVE